MVDAHSRAGQTRDLVARDKGAASGSYRAKLGHGLAIACHNERLACGHGVNHLRIVVAKVALRDYLAHVANCSRLCYVGYRYSAPRSEFCAAPSSADRRGRGWSFPHSLRREHHVTTCGRSRRRHTFRCRRPRVAVTSCITAPAGYPLLPMSDHLLGLVGAVGRAANRQACAHHSDGVQGLAGL